MNQNLNKIINYFQKNNLNISNIKPELESQEYNATKFQLNEKKVIFRTGKSTPTKPGFFVTFWKRNQDKITVPFDFEDNFDYYIAYINNESEDIEGFFIFSKKILLENKIITDNPNNILKGKNGFRLYTPNLKELNKQATKSQTWQTKHFISIEELNKLNQIFLNNSK